MSKPKARRPTTSPARAVNPFELAAAVADRVQIHDVRLVECHARQTDAIGRGKRPIQLANDVETDFVVASEAKSILVLARFQLRGWVGKDVPGADPPLSIGGTFGLRYSASSLDHLGDDQLRAFAQINGVFNAWPYWREFVQNSAARMGLPRLILPVFRFTEPSTGESATE